MDTEGLKVGDIIERQACGCYDLCRVVSLADGKCKVIHGVTASGFNEKTHSFEILQSPEWQVVGHSTRENPNG